MREYDFVIVGAGSAGRTAVETIVEQEPSSSVILIDQEKVLPYKRTHVSKNVRKGIFPDQFAVHDKAWYSNHRVELVSGSSVDGLYPSERRISVAGEQILYRSLLLATGARPSIPFPTMPRERWTPLWTESDGRVLHQALSRNRRFVVVGTGVLGVEAAWQLTSAGAEVVMVGRTSWPMRRYLDSLSAGILAETLKNGSVDLRLNHNVTTISTESTTDAVVVGTDRGRIIGDYVVLAVGSEPESTLAESSGLDVGCGIMVDTRLKTSDNSIWAAGDCAEHPDGRITGLWHSAEDQGRLAALSMLGRDVNNGNPPFRLKCEVYNGFWFSAGPISAVERAPVWDDGRNLWRPVFVDDRLTAMTGCARGGLDKTKAKRVQKLVLEGASAETARRTLAELESES